MSEPQLEQPVVNRREPVLPEVKRNQLYLFIIRVFPHGSTESCVVTRGIFSAVVKEVEDEKAMKALEETLRTEHVTVRPRKETSPGASSRAASAVTDQVIDRWPIRRQEFSDLKLEGLNAQSQVFYFSGSKLQHTKAKGDRLIRRDLFQEVELQREVRDLNRGVTFVFDLDGNVLDFKAPEEADPFGLALSCIVIAKMARDKGLTGRPSQLLDVAAKFKDEEVFRQCVTKKGWLFGKEFVDPNLFVNNMQEILNHAKRFVIGIESGAYV